MRKNNSFCSINFNSIASLISTIIPTRNNNISSPFIFISIMFTWICFFMNIFCYICSKCNFFSSCVTNIIYIECISSIRFCLRIIRVTNSILITTCYYRCNLNRCNRSIFINYFTCNKCASIFFIYTNSIIIKLRCNCIYSNWEWNNISSHIHFMSIESRFIFSWYYWLKICNIFS